MSALESISSILAKRTVSALQMGPQKKVSTSNPLISHGQHFGQTVFTLCNYPSLLMNGILRLEQMEDSPLEDFSADKQREHGVFKQLLDSYPGLLEHLQNGSEEEIIYVEESVRELQAPEEQRSSYLYIENSKIDHGFNHELTGSLLCPAGLDWSDPDLLVFEDPDGSVEVNELLMWWNCQVFPTSSAAKRPISTNSALLKIRLKWLAAKQAADVHSS
ncbi:hypothetical protein CY34DRAFT_17090 [Suillus luteus UH-Slu-Lm8-n1]|uniref:Uncharacterized protein n=1 Tax=Suillus luteus UH-Slu-Lm8-n1 TaxID=930992 RepID=A0A0D0AB42_9AGAM|nr:hypothetical protein CY34DRAFT_17090 [Suillus luteus UH-Slu-Lm8-n1]